MFLKQLKRKTKKKKKARGGWRRNPYLFGDILHVNKQVWISNELELAALTAGRGQYSFKWDKVA